MSSSLVISPLDDLVLKNCMSVMAEDLAEKPKKRSGRGKAPKTFLRRRSNQPANDKLVERWMCLKKVVTPKSFEALPKN